MIKVTIKEDVDIKQVTNWCIVTFGAIPLMKNRHAYDQKNAVWIHRKKMENTIFFKNKDDAAKCIAMWR